jgi:hypothetical protein
VPPANINSRASSDFLSLASMAGQEERRTGEASSSMVTAPRPNHPHHRRVNTTSGRNNHQETPLPLLATTAGQKLRCYRVEGITPLLLLATSAGQQERKNTIPELQEAACSHKFIEGDGGFSHHHWLRPSEQQQEKENP